MELKTYTEKSIVLIGETTPFKESLSKLGGKWNSNLKNEKGEKFGGWIFPLSKKNIVEDFLKNTESGKLLTDKIPIKAVTTGYTVEQRLEYLENQVSELLKILKTKDTTNNKVNKSDFEIEYDDEEEDIKPRKRLLKK